MAEAYHLNGILNLQGSPVRKEPIPPILVVQYPQTDQFTHGESNILRKVRRRLRNPCYLSKDTLKDKGSCPERRILLNGALIRPISFG